LEENAVTRPWHGGCLGGDDDPSLAPTEGSPRIPMNMTPCPDCAGLIPARCDACPNCDAKPSLARKVTAAAAAGATAMTLMACYGAGDYGYEPQWPTSPTAACNLATPLVVDAGNAFASDRSDGGRASDAFKSPCGLNSGPERVFYYDPSEV